MKFLNVTILFIFRLFMTHFGGVGTMEAIWTAVPMVGMALEGDQGQKSAIIFASNLIHLH